MPLKALFNPCKSPRPLPILVLGYFRRSFLSSDAFLHFLIHPPMLAWSEILSSAFSSELSSLLNLKNIVVTSQPFEEVRAAFTRCCNCSLTLIFFLFSKIFKAKNVCYLSAYVLLMRHNIASACFFILPVGSFLGITKRFGTIFLESTSLTKSSR